MASVFTVRTPCWKSPRLARTLVFNAVASRCKVSVAGSFRRKQKIPGVTIVHNAATAKRALKELRRLANSPHAWDTEAADVRGISRHDYGSSVTHGRVLCATCYCGEEADFGSGPRLFIDNDGSANGLLHKYFKEYFEDDKFQKVFHNYSFDRHLLAHHDIDIRGFHADTLHLARLVDTSLSSWEGVGQRQFAQRAMPDISEASAHPSSSSRGKLVQIQGATLGGLNLETKSWTSGVSMLHTSALTDTGKTGAGKKVKGPTGYGLKALVKHYKLAGEDHGTFSEKFGNHATAAEEAHNCEESFDLWTNYATSDAVLTHRLFDFLKIKLASTDWCSAVHERPLFEIMRDRRVAAELRKGRGAYGSAAQYSTGLKMWDLYEMYLRDFGVCLADLEQTGIRVNREHLVRVKELADEHIQTSHGAFVHGLETAQGPDGDTLVADADLINIGSSQQLQTLMFGGSGKNRETGEPLPASRTFPAPKKPKMTGDSASKKKDFELKGLGLTPISKMKNFTKKGQPSASAAVLANFVGRADVEEGLAYQQLLDRGNSEDSARTVAEGLKQLREAKKTRHLVSGFVTPLLAYSEATGRIHPQWKFDTSTGRLACRSPNLQNLPTSANDSFGIRASFEAAPGNILVVADYSQLELRILAHVANCESMISRLTDGGDYHSEVASEMFPHIEEAVRRGEVVVERKGDCTLPTIKEVFGNERSKAKAVNFGIIFGKEGKSLGEDLDIPTREAEDLIRAWYRSKPAVMNWRTNAIKESKKSKQALSLLGRWRTLPLIHEAVYESRSQRAAVNFGIQGSAADVVLGAMLRIWKSQKSGKLKELGFELVLQVHDEFVLEGPEEHAAEASELVADFMREPFKDHRPDFRMRVPLIADVAFSTRFSEAKA